MSKTSCKFTSGKWQLLDYLMIDLKSKGGAATPTRGDGRLIVYGIKGTHNDVSSSVLDAAYVVENGKMVMETDLDLNGKRLLNYNPKSKTVIFGQYDKESETIKLIMRQIIMFLDLTLQ